MRNEKWTKGDDMLPHLGLVILSSSYGVFLIQVCSLSKISKMIFVSTFLLNFVPTYVKVFFVCEMWFTDKKNIHKHDGYKVSISSIVVIHIVYEKTFFMRTCLLYTLLYPFGHLITIMSVKGFFVCEADNLHRHILFVIGIHRQKL
ncbi:unnamed protein product [Cuscuta epithymum]|uniref:Uncharacterized protein n=1 Tax=Cuscuta epithymum TaxID=186058 RepID=A0AAV0DD29_9ASTE|nr:unnamed protein product [Cuscuta epithymum]